MRLSTVILPIYRRAAAGAVWRRAEELGFHAGYTYDHLSWQEFRDRPWFGALPTLVTAALATDRLRVGTLVTSPNFRHPVPLAKDLMTLDDVSDGRLTVGIGSGGTGFDASVLGGVPWSAGERTERFGEFVSLLDRLLTEPATTEQLPHYAAVEARMIPGCVRVRNPGITETTTLPGTGEGDNNAVYPGGTWYEPDGWLTWAYASLGSEVPHSGSLALDEYERSTLAAHAASYPNEWVGTASIDDTCWSFYSSDPGRCGGVLGITAYEGQNTEQPEWMVMDALTLAGVTPTKLGYEISPHLPLASFSVRFPTIGVAKGKRALMATSTPWPPVVCCSRSPSPVA